MNTPQSYHYYSKYLIVFQTVLLSALVFIIVAKSVVIFVDQNNGDLTELYEIEEEDPSGENNETKLDSEAVKFLNLNESVTLQGEFDKAHFHHFLIDYQCIYSSIKLPPPEQTAV